MTDKHRSATGATAVEDETGNALIGLTTDIAVTGDNPGTQSAKLRGLLKIFTDVWDSANHALKIGAVLQGDIEFGAVELKDGTTDTRGKVADATTIVAADNAAAVKDFHVGLTTDAAVDTDANGTLNAHVRGLNKSTGATTDAAVVGDNNGSVTAKLRGLTKMLNDVWDSVNHVLHTNVGRVGGTAVSVNAGAADAGTLRVAPATAEVHLGEVGNPLATPSANFTRPADTTAYASGDLVANSVTAGSVAALSWATAARVAAGSFLVRRARLKKSTTGVTSATFRLHLYSSDPAASSGILNGDNGAWSTNASGYLGSIDLDIAGTSGRAMRDSALVQGAPPVGQEINVKLSSGQTIYGLLEARAAYTPGSAEVFTVELELQQN